MKNELYHFNPFHDRLGRFAKASGGGGRSYPSESEMQSAIKRRNIEKQYDKVTGRSSNIQATRDRLNDSSNAVNRANDVLKKRNKQDKNDKPRLDLSKMSDKELRDRINRENLERQYNDLFNNQRTVSKGRQRVERLLDAAGDAMVVTSSALTLALLLKQVMGDS